MAVSTTGEVHLHALPASESGSGLPTHFMHLHGFSVSDASGGHNVLTFPFPKSLATQMILCSPKLGGGTTARVLYVELFTGVVHDGVEEVYQTFVPAEAALITGVTVGAGSIITFPSFIFVPNENAQSVCGLRVRCTNSNGETLSMHARALGFDPKGLRYGPMKALPLFLMH